MTSSEDNTHDGSQAHRYGISFWTSAVIGLLIMAFGVRGLFSDRSATPPRGFAQWFVGSAIVHDALIAPCAFAIAWAVGWALPRRAVIPVRLGLATSALLVAFAWPLVRGYGRRAANPTALPLDYGRNLVVALIVVWIVVLATIATTAVRGHRARHNNGGSVPQ